MPRRVNPVILLGLIIAIALSFVLSAGALSGGTASDAVGVGEAQMGKPFVFGTDGPDTFSCVGLMRYILRTTGVDGDAPWVPEEYLSRYAPVDLANLQPGDIVIMPGWATMYVGNGMLLNANEALGYVTETPMDVAGAPLGAVRPPYGGSAPAPGGATDPTMAADPAAAQPVLTDPAVTDTTWTDPVWTDPAATDPVLTDPAATDATWTDPVWTDPAATDPMMFAPDPALTGPALPAEQQAPLTDQAALPTDPLI